MIQSIEFRVISENTCLVLSSIEWAEKHTQTKCQTFNLKLGSLDRSCKCFVRMPVSRRPQINRYYKTMSTTNFLHSQTKIITIYSLYFNSIEKSVFGLLTNAVKPMYWALGQSSQSTFVPVHHHPFIENLKGCKIM